MKFVGMIDSIACGMWTILQQITDAMMTKVSVT
jgi:hypothetical protein